MAWRADAQKASEASGEMSFNSSRSSVRVRKTLPPGGADRAELVQLGNGDLANAEIDGSFVQRAFGGKAFGQIPGVVGAAVGAKPDRAQSRRIETVRFDGRRVWGDPRARRGSEGGPRSAGLDGPLPDAIFLASGEMRDRGIGKSDQVNFVAAEPEGLVIVPSEGDAAEESGCEPQC